MSAQDIKTWCWFVGSAIGIVLFGSGMLTSWMH